MAKIKDITVRFNADTKSLLESQGVFDKINEKVKQQEGLIGQLTAQERELLKLRQSSQNTANIETYNKQLAEIKDKQNALKGNTENLNTSHQKFNQTLLQIGSSLGIAFGVAEVINFGKESVKAFLDAEKNAKALEFALKNIAKASDAAFKSLLNQSGKLQEVTIFSDDAVQQSQTMLLQFGLTAKQVEKLIPQIADLASAQNIELSAATDKVISGINGQGRALRDAGIVMEDTGSKTKNLAIISDELSKFQGAAASTADTLSGKLKLQENQVDELSESIGEKLAPAWISLKSIALNSIDSAIDQFKAKYSTLATQISILFGGLDKKQDTKGGEIMFGSLLDANKKYINKSKKLLEDLSESEKVADDLTIKGINATETAKQKAAEEEAKRIKEAEENETKAAEKRTERMMQQQADGEKARLKELEDIKKHEEEKEKAELDAEKKRNELLLEEAKRKAQLEKDIDKSVFDAAFEVGNTLLEIKQQWDKDETDSQLANLEMQKKNRQITEEQYMKMRADILRKQWKADRENNITKVMMNWAQASITAAASAPWPYNLPAMIFASASGSAALAQVLAQKEPKFAKGVIDLKGQGTETSDSIQAMLSKGESVMTAAETREHKELLTAIRNKNFEDYVFREYVKPAVMKAVNPGLAENTQKSIELNFDMYEFSRTLRRNNKVVVENMPDSFGISESELKLLRRRGIN